MKTNVVIGFLGTQLDAGKRRRWRPTVALTRHDDFPVGRLELIHDGRYTSLAERIRTEIESSDAGTEVLLRRIDMRDPWDFQEVYGALFDFARDYGFDEDREDASECASAAKARCSDVASLIAAHGHDETLEIVEGWADNAEILPNDIIILVDSRSASTGSLRSCGANRTSVRSSHSRRPNRGPTR